MLAFALASAPAGLAATFTVTSSDDVDDEFCDPLGHCSLREAINASNVSADRDEIRFNVGAGGLLTLRPQSQLPQIEDGVVIDGFSQPGGEGDPNVHLLGVDAGEAAIGLRLFSSGSNVGGLIIGGFSFDGIRIEEGGSNVIDGNWIGVDFSGLVAQGNGGYGVLIQGGADQNVVGQPDGRGNVISGNGFSDVAFSGVGVFSGVGNSIRFNRIGTDANGTGSIPNAAAGVVVNNATDTEIRNNVIRGNGGEGVLMVGTAAGTVVTSNSIDGNGGLGIDILPAGVNENDPGDGDEGANGLQNAPALESASTDGSTVSVSGALDSVGETTYRLEFFQVADCDPSGSGEGNRFIGTSDVQTGAFSFTYAAEGVPANSSITATATAPNGDTSEFSNCATVDGGGEPPPTGLVVNVTDDDVDEAGCTAAHCSIREAIQGANANADASTITFAIPGAGPHTIIPHSPLPNITQPVTIDGYSQPGASANTLATGGTNAVIKIELAGNLPLGESSFEPGLTITGAGSTIKGLAINGGFFLYGIFISGAGASGNEIAGSFIGTDPTGTIARGVRQYGVVVADGAHDNKIGNLDAAGRNLLSGTAGPCLGCGAGLTFGRGAHDNDAANNLIGTNAAGTGTLANGTGVNVLSGSFANTIGGPSAAYANVIANNSSHGVHLQQEGTNDNVVSYNTVRANGGAGVDVTDGVLRTQIAHNEIAQSGAAGVLVSGSTTRNKIQENAIRASAGLGIDLSPFGGVTPNDDGDADVGPNDLQNFPVLDEALRGDGFTRVVGTLRSAPSTLYRIDFYANAECDASGHGEAERWIGWAEAATNADGLASFDTETNLTASVLLGEAVSATATDPNGNTSELADCADVADEAAGTIDNLEITGDRESIGAGLRSVPMGQIPAARIPFFAGAPPSNVGSLPVADVPVADVPVADVALASSPVGDIPVGDIGLGTLGSALGSVLLSSIVGPLDAVLAEFPGRPAHTITLADVFADPEAAAAFRQLTLAQTNLSQTLLRGVRLVSLLYGTRPASFWCQLLTARGLSCGGLAGANGTLLAVDVGGADISSSEIGSLPVADVPVADVPVADVPVGDIDLAASRLGAILIRNLSSPNAVVDCARIDCSAASPRTLADAAALSPSAIRAGATFAQLAGAFGSITIDESIMALLLRSEYPWGALPLDGLQDAVGTGQLAGYQVDFDLACAVSAVTVTVTLPPGFFPAAGSSRLAVGAAPSAAIANPTAVSGGDDVESDRRFRWSNVSVTGCPTGATMRHVSLSFDAYAGLELGLFESQATVRAAEVSRTATGAPITVAENFEDNDTAQASTAIPPDTLDVVHISSSLDREYFRIDNPPRGWRTKVYLEQVPDDADFDLVATTSAPSSLVSSPVADVSLGSLPITDPGTSLSNNPDDTLPPETLHDIPAPASAPVGDIPVGDIPVADVPVADVPVADVSAKRGSEDEAVVLFSNGEPGTITIGVSGYNGSFSSRPAVVRVRRIPPPSIPPCPARTFPFDSSPYSGGDETLPALPASLPAATRSLLLVARDRMEDLYGEPAANAMLASLNSVAAHAQVGGAVVFVDADPAVRAALQAWDANPCSVDLANDVVRKINAVVARYRAGLTNLRYVVAHGSDEAFPYARVPDLVTLSPESNYASSLAFTTQNMTRGNALFAASALGYVLTDNALGTFTRTDWLNRELYLPSISVSRMVETPAEIEKQYGQFLAANGVLDASTTSALTGSIDFLAEAGEAAAAGAATRAGGGVTTLAATAPWDAAAVLTGASGRKLWSVNAHQDHFRLQPASLSGGVLTSGQLLPAVPDGSVPEFSRLVSFTAGCHAGLNVANTLGGDAARLRDLPQAHAQQQAAVYLANLGYGYGETAPGGNGLSEKWISLFSETLDDDTTFGEKKVATDHAYFQQMGTYGVFDEKALIEVASYGPPWYRFGGGSAPEQHVAPDAPVDPATGLATATLPLNLAPLLQRHDDPLRGSFWTANGDAHFSHYRVPQPVVTRNVTRAGERARGAALTALSTEDLTIDPFFSTPIVFSAAHEPEPKFTDSTYPANFTSINTSFPFGRATDTLTFLAGQFRAPNVERLVRSATVQVFYSNSSDVSPPLFLQSGSILNGNGTATIFSKVIDRGGAGIKRVAALYTEGGPWQFVVLEPAGGALYTRTVNVGGPIHALHWAVDGGGNVGTSTDKGFLFTSRPPDDGAPSIQIDQPLDGGAYTLGASVPARYACSDEGGIQSCTGTVANRQPFDTSTVGEHSFTVTATDLSGNQESLEVNYRVGYGFSGFLAPVDNPPALNQATAGRTVPIKWQLRNGAGAFIRSLSTVVSITSQPVDCENRPAEAVPDTSTSGGSELTYDVAGEQFVYQWRTDRAWRGTCRRLTVRLNDGTAPFVDFRFR